MLQTFWKHDALIPISMDYFLAEFEELPDPEMESLLRGGAEESFKVNQVRNLSRPATTGSGVRGHL
jgi:hypothetical protein